MDFHLDPAAGAIKTIAPGVTRQTLAGGFAYEFDSPTPLKWENEEVTFRGRRGGIVVDKAKGTARFVLLDAEQASHNQMELWEDGAPTGTGPYDVTFYPDRVVGKSEGTHNFLYLMPPPGLDKLPMLLIDGQPYAPGMGRGSIVVPVMPGKHSWELRALDQPMVSRNWQEW